MRLDPGREISASASFSTVQTLDITKDDQTANPSWPNEEGEKNNSKERRGRFTPKRNTHQAHAESAVEIIEKEGEGGKERKDNNCDEAYKNVGSRQTLKGMPADSG